jgi:hypothetical protein
MSEHPEIRELERRISVLERGRDPQAVVREAPIFKERPFDGAMAVELEDMRNLLAAIDDAADVAGAPRDSLIVGRIAELGRIIQRKNQIIRDLHCQIASKEAVINRMEAYRNEAIAASTADNKEIAAPHRWQAEIDAWERGEPIEYRNLKIGRAWIMVPSKASLLQAHVAPHSWDSPGEFRIKESDPWAYAKVMWATGKPMQVRFIGSKNGCGWCDINGEPNWAEISINALEYRLTPSVN